MSGDVQPRKRKDKNKKKKEDDVITRHDLKETKESTPVGVHAGAMGPDDIHLHVHKDHGIGGNWCVKVVFFSLLTILLGIAALILLENRGVSDVDTPVTESRFQEYFEGWVEEKPESHDDHDHIIETLNNSHDDHDDHDDDEGQDDHVLRDAHSGEVPEEDEHETEEQSSEVQSGDKNHEVESNEDEGIEADVHNSTESDEDEQDTQNSGDNEEGDNQFEPDLDLPELVRSKRGAILAEAFNGDNDDSEDGTINPFNNDERTNSEEFVDQHLQAEEDEDQHSESNNNDEEDSNDKTILDNTPIQDENDDSHENFSDVSPFDVHVVNDENVENSFNPKSTSNYPIDKKPEEEEEEDDGSFEDDKFFENDSGEDLHLEKLSKQEGKTEEPEVPQASSLTVKLIIGLALVGVAAQVFARRSTTNDDDNDDHRTNRKMEKEDSYDELSMKRRLTIADDEVAYDDECDEYEDEYDGDEGDEVEYDDDEEYEEKVEPAPKLKTFEQFDAIYKAKADLTSVQEPVKITPKESPKLFDIASKRFEPPIPAVLLAKSEAPKFVDPLFSQNLTVRQDAFRRDISPNALIPPKQPSPTPQNQLFSTEPKQPSPTPQKQLFTTPPKQPSPIPLQKQPSPTRPPIQSSHVDLKSVEAIPIVSKLLPDELSKPSGSVFPPYHPDDDDDDDDEEYADEDEEEYSGSEEEEEGDEDEEDISDVDDFDLLKRLDEKYGKLPNKPVSVDGGEQADVDADEHGNKDKSWTNLPTRSGPQSVNHELEGEINEASNLLINNPKAALSQIELLIKKYQQTPELLYWKAFSLDRLSVIYKSNEMLEEAIQHYQKVLEYESKLNDTFFKSVGEWCIKRIRFLGSFEKAIPVHEQLINRFSDNADYQNQLAVTYFLLERLEDAKTVSEKVLLKWRENGFAHANFGLALKLLNNNSEQAVIYLKKGIESKEEGTNEGRYYYHLGDALIKLQKMAEAREIFKKGADLKLFLSENQRSLHNIERLKSRPFWTKEETTYETDFDILQRNWNIIRQEGLSVLNEKGLFTKENEHLQDTGLWTQFHLYMSGRRLNKNCEKTPITCKLIDQFPAAKYCGRGQVKFSVMHPDTHVFPHCGPTNCRLRAHLGLTVPPGAFLRVGDEIRTWQEGQFLIFDDSFEHEVWHNGTIVRLVLIVDIWHPDLTTEERAFL